ncbi:hypothetical protein HA402_014407 [Bradysia odoriphaga]|nr:hypothetical protein HA402_014407 [Bradysia odoriphaga]
MRNAPMTLDIIVFPEMTLNQMQTAVEILEPKDKVSPCDSVDYLEDNLVKQMSCSAKMYQRYVVVGVVTKVDCPDEDMIEQNDQPLELIRSQNITDIIYPTMWYSEMPFLTAVPVQHSWAYTNNINLLAAGANNPLIGSTGTGIFAGRRGSLISVMEGMNTTNLYTAVVPKIGLGDQIPVMENSVERRREEVAVMALNSENLENYTVQFCEISCK